MQLACQAVNPRTRLSPEDPFALLRRELAIDPAARIALPFPGGAIGYFGYDLARRIEKLPACAEDAERIPEMAVGLYDWACVVDHHERRSWLVAAGRELLTESRWPELVARFSAPLPERSRVPFAVKAPVASNMTAEGYARAFERVQRYIHEGDCYQINLAQRFAAPAGGDPWLAYQALRVINPAPYSAYLNTPGAQILSASPERFLRVERGHVETRPIKGTRPRAGHPRLDAELAEELRGSEKDRAENVMIVDVLRNDLGRACETGSIEVPSLCELETFAQVHHLTSTVTGRPSPSLNVTGPAERSRKSHDPGPSCATILEVTCLRKPMNSKPKSSSCSTSWFIRCTPSGTSSCVS